jgi:amidase
MCAVAHGTDIAGSIRYPAYVNGVIGLRTTSGRIPAYHPTTTQRFYGLQSMSAQGPLARSVADAHLGLRAMIGADTRDPTWVNVGIEHDDDAEPVKVALVDEIPNAPVCDEVKKALLQAATSLAAAGYVVERAQPPAIEECLEIWQSIVMTESRCAMIAAVAETGDLPIMQSVHNMAA